MNRIKKIIVKLLPFLVFFFLSMVIFLTNYIPHTFLTGWDDLHSEFNLSDNITRSLISVWQDYEGPGTFLGVNDAADLPRLLIVWILSLVAPANLIRYLLHFLMLFIGTAGMYVVIKTFFMKENGKKAITAAFFGGLFYLLNLGTVQYFAVPFEPFSVYWAMFPWLMYVTLLYTTSPTRKNLIIFALLNFFAAPMAFEHTIFYVYLLIVVLFFISEIFIIKTKNSFKVFLTVFVVIFAVNAFWFVPHAYWVITSRGVQRQATINNLSTGQTFQTVQKFGDMESFMLLKNKPWDYFDFNDGQQKYILQQWHDHLANPAIRWIGYFLFAVVILGLVTGKSRRLFVAGLFLLGFLFLANQTPVAREFNLLFRKVDILNQVFRDPFTKFIPSTLFVFAIGFSWGILFIYKKVPLGVRKYTVFLGVVVLATGLFVYGKPFFSGNLLADRMRQTVPGYYFEFFDYMNHQDASKRVADLPQGQIWGWMSYDWGYTGSGFLWHGISQSIMNRTFDVWNNKNEEYYWEMVYALSKRDDALLNAILKKYNISYVMFDSAIYFPDNPNSVFTILRQKEFLDNDAQLTKVKTFGTIDLYETNIPNNKFVSFIKNPVQIQTETNWLQNDKGFQDYGTYIATDNTESSNEIFYPFRSLFSGRGSSDTIYNVSQTDTSLIFTQSVPRGFITFPQNVEEEFIRFDPNDLHATKKEPEITLNENPLPIATSSSIIGGSLKVSLAKDFRYGSYDSSLEKEYVLGVDVYCGENTAGKESKQKLNGEKEEFVRFSSVNSSSCRVIYLPELFYKSGYLVAIKSRNVQGSPLHFWVENLTDKRSDLQVLLKKQADFYWEYFVIPPMAEDGIGYTLHFDNISVGDKEIVNDLAQVVVYPIPYRFLTGTKITSDNSLHVETMANSIEKVEHRNSSAYAVTLQGGEISDKTILVLSQSYNRDWKAYVVDSWWSKTLPVLFGRELKNHVKINNWANGWDIGELKNNNVEIAIIFLPQLLEYLGFILLPIPFIYALWPRKKRKTED